MAGVQVEVVGADRLAAGLGRAGRALARLDLTPAGQVILEQAGRRVPRRSGRLAAGHQLVTEPGGAVAVVNVTRYAGAVHAGWAGHPGRPWLHTAAQASEGQWLARLDQAAQGVLDTALGD